MGDATPTITKRRSVMPPDTLKQPILGTVEETTEMQLFEDYACPHCYRFETEILPIIKEDYIKEEKLHIKYYDFPLPVSRHSKPAAVSGRIVQYLGDDEKFWEYKKAVMEKIQNGKDGNSVYKNTADSIGVDGQTVIVNIDSPQWKAVVEEDKEHGLNMGVPGTPGVVLDGELVEYKSFTDLLNIISSTVTN